MDCFYVVLLLHLVALFWNCTTILSLNHNPLLLLISFDGFRYDLLNATLVPNIWQFAQEGVLFVEGSRSQYLSYTAPNHASISTGRLEESHGIVANKFYDPISQQFYDLFNDTGTEGIVNASLQEHFYSGEPIWLSNERAQEGRRSASMFWPAGDAYWPQAPHRPAIFRSWTGYKNRSEWMKDFDEIVELFTRPDNPVNFIAWYIAEPDYTLHKNGFYNGELTKKLMDLDLTFHYAIKKIEANEQLANRLNIILTADHGHAEISSPKNVFCISSYVDLTDIKVGDNMLYVSDEKRRNDIYEKLKKAVSEGNFKVNVYHKKDFPMRFGYKNTPRVGDIILEPHIGYAVHPNCPPELFEAISQNRSALHMSTHGMSPDEPEMRAFLVMKGPAFNENLKVTSIPNNTDLYPVMCHVLGVLEAPNNGSISNLLMALRVSETLPWAMPDSPLKSAFFDKFPTIVITVLLPGLMLLVFCIVFCCFSGSQDRDGIFSSKGYRLLHTRDQAHQAYPLRKAQNTVNNRLPPLDTLMSMSSEDEL